MPLIDKLKDKAVAALANPSDYDEQEEWASEGFDLLVSEARSLVDQGSPEGAASAAALGAAVRHKGALVDLGKHGLRSATAVLALGDPDDAARHAALVALREQASWDQVTDAIVGSAEAGNQRKRDLDAKHEAYKTAFMDIGIAGARALLPLLIALI